MISMSFAYTTRQMRKRQKTVTRRLGWLNLKPGDLLQAVVKCMGLKKGEKMEKICVIRVIAVRRERLCAMNNNFLYGLMECKREGFADLTPEQFVEMFCQANKCKRETKITRIAFEFVGEK